jgi:hypothetical protein
MGDWSAEPRGRYIVSFHSRNAASTSSGTVARLDVLGAQRAHGAIVSRICST